MGEYADMEIERALNEYLDGDDNDEEGYSWTDVVAAKPKRANIAHHIDTEWVGADGQVYEMTQMSHTHLINTIHLLERKGKKLSTSRLILVEHASYPYLVREAIRRNLITNPYNGIDITQPMTKQEAINKPITSELISTKLRKIDYEL